MSGQKIPRPGSSDANSRAVLKTATEASAVTSDAVRKVTSAAVRR